VWNIFVCFFEVFLALRFSSCFYFGGGHSSSFIGSLIGALLIFFIDDPSLRLQEYTKRNLLGTLEHLFLVGEWHVLRNSRCGR
jgi:hypothetical protein